MSELPTDDQPLIHFLKQHRPTAPEATPDLEERIIANLDAENEVWEQPISAWKWIPSLIAAGLTVFGITYRMIHSSTLSPIEQSQLEGFIESNWNGAMQETHETSWLTIPYNNSQD